MQRRRNLISPLLAATLLVASGFAAGLAWGPRVFGQDRGRQAEPRTVTARGDLAQDERSTIDLFRSAAPSVVYITSLSVRRNLFSRRVTEVPQGSGSGFIWDESGHVVTNFHVVRNASRSLVTLEDQSTWEAELVGAAPEKDLAVLRVTAPVDRLRPIALGSSRDLLVGQKVYAIGNPFGLDQTLTTGVISALEREIESLTRLPIRNVIQTDAAINPGNSGGPLLDSAGRLIGVNTQIYSPSGAYAGIGFAIPVDTVNWVVPELIEHGRLFRPALGVEVISTARLRQRGIPEGLLVVEVTPRSGAERAGIRPTRRLNNGRLVYGDIITAVDGREVASADDLVLALERFRDGGRVRISLERAGEPAEVDVDLSRPR